MESGCTDRRAESSESLTKILFVLESLLLGRLPEAGPLREVCGCRPSQLFCVGFRGRGGLYVTFCTYVGIGFRRRLWEGSLVAGVFSCSGGVVVGQLPWGLFKLGLRESAAWAEEERRVTMLAFMHACKSAITQDTAWFPPCIQRVSC